MKTIKHKNRNNIIFIVSLIAVACLGYGIAKITSPPPRALASIEDTAAARNAITSQYLAASSTDCTDATDPIKPADRVAIFNKYLQINGFANRAVIRGCNDADTLLYKNKAGQWVKTDVNIRLDSRANPEWQRACMIQDITIADTVVRPENGSIDSFNLATCRKLK